MIEAAATEGAGRWASLWRIEVPLAGDAPLLFAAALTVVAVAIAAYVIVGILEHILIDWD